MGDNGIDNKPKIRGFSARGRRKALETSQDLVGNTGFVQAEVHHDELNDSDANDLNIRVKDRGSEEIPKKGRIGGLFKEPPSTGIKGLFNKETAAGAASELKETIKRPLSGLFRRPGSKAGGRNRDEESNEPMMVNEERAPEKLDLSSTVIARRPSNAPVPGSNEWEATAKAPHIPKQQFDSVFQIDALGARHPHLTKLEDIDISLLMRYTCHEGEVRDEETPWNWDYLFATISTEMKEEWANDEEAALFANEESMLPR